MNIMVVFVGHHARRLIDTFRMVGEPVDAICLVRGENKNLEGEDICWSVTEDIQREVQGVWAVSVMDMDKEDVIKAIGQMTSYIHKEQAHGNAVIINASGSMRTLAIAGYFAACITKSRVLTALPTYDSDGRDIGAKKIIDIPLLPIMFPSGEQQDIIDLVRSGITSISSIVEKLQPGLAPQSQEVKNERSRISHHLAKMEELRLVTRSKNGREVDVSLTLLGRLFAKE